MMKPNRVISQTELLVPTQKRVIVVDDSQTMRKWLRLVLEADPRLVVVAEAADALEAREVIRTHRPDVVILDIVMPKMDGLDFLERLMRLFPTPVIVLSSLTAHDPHAKERALSLGAVDCLAKPSYSSDARFTADFQERVFQAATPKTTTASVPPAEAKSRHGKSPLILIGASTGGVTALETVLSHVDPKGPPVFIVQHMPEKFLFSFVARLDGALAQNVHLAKDGLIAAHGDIIFAPTNGRHTVIHKTTGGWTCKFKDNASPALHVPSIEEMFISALPYASQTIAVMLTGLGQDGAEAMASLRNAGARTIGQDKTTSAVYGMPRAAFEAGAIQQQLELEKIGGAINETVKDHHKSRTKNDG